MGYPAYYTAYSGQAPERTGASHATIAPLTHHIFGEPGPAVAIDIDADTDLMQGCAKKVDTMPATERLVGHAFLNGGYSPPGSRIRSCQADILTTVRPASKAFIANALIGSASIGAVMAETAMCHVPTMQQSARSQSCIPSERWQTTGGTIMVDQLEELLGKLLRFS